jgi:hypothetical protein
MYNTSIGVGIQVVGGHEDDSEESAILPDNRQGLFMESYLRQSSEISSTAPAQALQDTIPGEQNLETHISTEALQSMLGNQLLSSAPIEASIDLFIEIQHHGKDGLGSKGSHGPNGKGEATNATDLVVYRCILETWNDICRYIASPESVDSGTSWVTSGVCTQVFPHVPGSPVLIGTRF